MRITALASSITMTACFIGGPDENTETTNIERTCFGVGGILAATVEHRLETYVLTNSVYLRLTLDPDFVDNTFGTTSIGWTKKREFKQLVGSDHAQLVLTDAGGRVAVDAKLDYISVDPSVPSGYRSLGVVGGDGKMLVGDPATILEVTSSLARNFNERGYARYTIDSPLTDSMYAADPSAPDWEFPVVYEAWVDLAAFGTTGFGTADLDFIHASPSKLDANTVFVEPIPCPPPRECENPDGCEDRGGNGEWLF